MKKAAKITGSVLFYGLLVVVIVAVFMFARSTDEDKSIFGYRFYEVLSGSMRPTIDVGELAVVKIVDPEDVQVGDIVTKSVSDDGSLTLTHRVIDVFEDENGVKMVQTQGDNNVDADEPMPASNIIGTVEMHIPGIGHVVGFLKENILYVIFVAAALLVLVFVLRILLGKDKSEESLENQQRAKAEKLEKEARELIERAEDLLSQARTLRMKNPRPQEMHPYRDTEFVGGVGYSTREGYSSRAHSGAEYGGAAYGPAEASTVGYGGAGFANVPNSGNSGFVYQATDTTSYYEPLEQMPFWEPDQAMDQALNPQADRASYQMPNQPSSQVSAYYFSDTPKGVDKTMMPETHNYTGVKGGQVGRPVVPLE